MAAGNHHSFALTNGLSNRLLIPLLKNRAERRLGRRFTVVEYFGRRTGRHHQLVTQYVIEGSTLRINVGMPQRKTWWRNFITGHPLHLQAAGHDYHTTAHVVRDDNHVSVVAELNLRAS